ncbi:MAG: metal ABC transporter permease [Phycisphaerales bacterium]|nr:metal ABC transporter permease [Planctomycetota bacterium]MBL6997710.1 metal ABC transporter permease [Phycisphaerales bacterium]
MSWSIIDTWIIIIGALCAAGCAIPGTILVLRRMSMMGDAISHTVLPGIAIAFLVTGSRDPTAMLIGSVAVGLLTAFLIQGIQSLGKVEAGASMGIVFTVLFAFGLVLMRQAVDHVDIDPDCVLYGSIELAWFDQEPDGLGIPRGAIVNSVMLLANLFVVLLFYKEFKITSFDPALAKSQGIQPSFMHYLLMTMTATTAVAAFETVGSILVVAMFIVPPATAYLLTNRFGMMFVFSIALSIVAAALGHLSAITIPTWFGFSGTSTAGAMAVATGVLFIVVLLVSPNQGMISRLWRRLSVRILVIREDILGLLWRLEERGQGKMLPIQLSEAIGTTELSVRMALLSLKKRGSVSKTASSWSLTERGRTNATKLVRSHRLWEVYLDKHFPQDTHQLHHAASRLEHVTTDAMESNLGHAEVDPHGSPVPDEE